jgi:hypothetical protein
MIKLNEDEWAKQIDDFVQKSILVLLNSRINITSGNEQQPFNINSKVNID